MSNRKLIGVYTLLCLLLAVRANGDDSDQIAKAKKELDIYYNNIKILEFVYRQHYTLNTSSTLVQRILEVEQKNKEKIQQRTKKSNDPTAIKDDDKAKRGEPQARHNVMYYSCVEKFPSIRLFEYDGPIEAGIINIKQYQNQNTFTEIKENGKVAFESNKMNISAFDALPSKLMGLRMPNSINRTLSSLLVPENTKFLGTEIIKNHTIIKVQIGPNFSESTKLPTYQAGAWIVVDLDTSIGFLPIKFSYMYPDKQKTFNKTVEIQEYQEITDEQNHGKVLFPARIRESSEFGINIIDIINPRLNLTLSGNTFVPKIPDGYVVKREGEKRSRRLTGGIQSKENRVAEITAKTKKMLEISSLEENMPVQSYRYKEVAIILVAAVTVFTLFVYFRRRKDA